MSKIATMNEKELSLPYPLGPRILVKKLVDERFKKAEERSKIILTDDSKIKSSLGYLKAEVIAIGSTAFKSERFKYVYGDFSNEVKVGDIVGIKPYSGISALGTQANEDSQYQYILDESVEGIFESKIKGNNHD
ncbi:MAG: hypothetical protein ACFFD1_00150 [Candidatus Thorarchaeota archaeon]